MFLCNSNGLGKVVLKSCSLKELRILELGSGSQGFRLFFRTGTEDTGDILLAAGESSWPNL